MWALDQLVPAVGALLAWLFHVDLPGFT